jgi:hypothetical protein
MAQRGGVLCVLEAKREGSDPYDAKEHMISDTNRK